MDAITTASRFLPSRIALALSRSAKAWRSSNPVSKLKSPREPSGRTRCLTDKEEKRLMKALPSDEDRAAAHRLSPGGATRADVA